MLEDFCKNKTKDDLIGKGGFGCVYNYKKN